MKGLKGSNEMNIPFIVYFIAYEGDLILLQQIL